MHQFDKHKFRLFFAMMVVGVMVCTQSAGQGKIVINEFDVNIAANGLSCVQFIELKNLGPGRQNIGCYIVANELHALSIPANTYLNPGDIYIIAGQSSIGNCGTTSFRTVDFDWTQKTSYTSSALTTRNSFFAAGMSTGNSTYPLVLFDENATPIDAVRTAGSTFATTNPITVPTDCGNKSLSAIDYNSAIYKFESITPNLGNNSSMSRSLDGGCTWEKTPTQKESPGQKNDLAGATSTLTATETNSLTCDINNQTFTSSKVISISPSPTALKPISYTTVSSQSSTFSSSSIYTPKTNLTTSSITYNNLTAGYYNILFEPLDTTCGQLPYPIVVYNPLVDITTSTTSYCPSSTPPANGSANIIITPSSTPSDYYSMAYTVIKTSDNTTITSGSLTSQSQSPIQISPLLNAEYKVTASPKYGCQNSKTFVVSLNCSVPIKLINFAAASTVSNNKFEITIDADGELKELIIESSSNAKSFVKIADIPFENRKGDQKITFEIPTTTDEFFRLVMIDIFGNRINSEIIRIKNNTQSLGIKVFPNPFHDDISLEHFTKNNDVLIACVLSVNGAVIKEQNFKLTPGVNKLKLSTAGLSKGSYILSLKKTSSPHIQYSNIIKQ